MLLLNINLRIYYCYYYYMRFNNNNFIKQNINRNIFDFTVKNSFNENIPLSNYIDNNPILIVNVASY